MSNENAPRLDPALAAGNMKAMAGYAARHFAWSVQGAVARPHLANPAWTLLEAARIGYGDVKWPVQYLSGKAQLERNLERERAMAAQSAGLSPLEQANQAQGV